MMNRYEELVKALRLNAKYHQAENALANVSLAADAIEDMSQYLYNFNNENLQFAYNKLEDYPSLFECSNCEWECYDTMCSDTVDYNYCPNCGRKIIKKYPIDERLEMILTNRNKIARMSDEEMVQFLMHDFDEIYLNKICIYPNCKVENKCEDCVLKWLQSVSDNNE